MSNRNLNGCCWKTGQKFCGLSEVGQYGAYDYERDSDIGLRVFLVRKKELINHASE